MPKNPYTVLKNEACEWIYKALSPRVRAMWCYPEKTLGEQQWNLSNLAERVRAAEQLGWDVRLRYVIGEGLRVEYVEKPPATPYWY